MIACIIPTLNEEEAIGKVLKEVPEEIDGETVEVIVLDGGSEDDTREIAESMGVTVVDQYYRGGKGAAMRQVLENIDADVYVFLDGDGTYDPGELDKLVRPILAGEADHVVGSRLEHREQGAISRFNMAGNTVFNWSVRLLYNTDIQDMLSGYRALSGDLVREMAVFRDGFGIETELTILTLDSDARLLEVPVQYANRRGDSKLSPVRDGFNILKTILWMARDTRPITFFTAISLVFVLAAIYPSYLVIEEKLATGFVQHVTPAILASLLYIFALQTFLFGLLADQQRSTQKRMQKLFSRG